MTAPATHVVMARIGAPWGIKGWVKLFSFSQPPENLMDYLQYEVEGPQGLETIEFDEIKAHGPGFVGHIKGCDVREVAVRYTGLELLIEKQRLPALEEGYYWHQLEGLRVQTEQGQDLGKVQYLMETGANDVLVVKGDGQSVDVKERLLPYVEGQVVKSIDLAKQLMIVAWDSEWD